MRFVFGGGDGALLLPCRVLHAQRIGKQLFHGRNPALIEVANQIDRVQPERSEPTALVVQKQALEFVHGEREVDGGALLNDDVCALVQFRLVAIERGEIERDAAVLDAHLFDGKLADGLVADRERGILRAGDAVGRVQSREL